MLTLIRFDEVAWTDFTLVPFEVEESYLLSTALDKILCEHFDWEEISVIKDYWEKKKKKKKKDVILTAAFRACACAGAG